MKKILLLAICGCTVGTLTAQTTAIDTVSTEAGYAKQVWYRLTDGAETATPKESWDIAFRAELMSATIFSNPGTQLWKYPDATIADWDDVDTTGMAEEWEEAINSPYDWQVGAFNSVAGSDQFDYGWGNYDMTTHNITGSVFFIIKLTNGDYKKLRIDELVSTTGTYTFTYANLDGSDEQEVTFLKADYSGKNFGYYSLVNNEAADLEPASEDWDLLFTQYTDLIAMGPDVTMPYGVTGVLVNEGVELVEVDEVDADTYVDYESHEFGEEKNIIGYDWKTYNSGSGEYVVADSTVYFVKDKAANIWKLVFTGFGGSATGDFIFSKELLEATSIKDATGTVASLAVYPNPATNGYVHLAYDLNQATAATISVYNYAGQLIWNQQTGSASGLNTATIQTSGWAAGMYIVSLEVGGQKTTQKIIVQ